MNHSTPGFPVLYYFLAFAQTLVHWVSDASSHLILSHLLLLLPSILPSIRVFSSELAICIRWWKYWSFSIGPSNEYSGLISFRLTGLISLQSKGRSRVFITSIWKHQFFSLQPSLWSNSHICTWHWKNHSLDSTDLCQQSDYLCFLIHGLDLS